MPSCHLMPLTPQAKGFVELIDESRRGGFRMLSRFEEEWQSGANRFDRPGEMILGVFEEGCLIGTGGRSIDPYEEDPAIGRVRHLYIAEGKRGSGMGRLLIAHTLRDAADHFRLINLRAPATAFGFYSHLGFARVVGAETVTHRVLL